MHPFTQQRGWAAEPPLVVERAEGTDLVDADGRRYINGVSSLWCNVHGHRHPRIDAAVRAQLDRVAHSMILGLTHGPAVELARRLVDLAPPGLSRVFYSDSGSTAVEIALKMAFQFWRQRGEDRTRFVALRLAYHGDTIKSVSVGGIDLFHSLYRPLLFDALRADPGDVEQMEALLDEHRGEVAAVIMEPLVQGAAGMIVHPKGYLRAVRQLCDRHDVLLILDEVATGFGRTGRMFACEHEGVAPDLLCLAKGITGGYLPLAATLTTRRSTGPRSDPSQTRLRGGLHRPRGAGDLHGRRRGEGGERRRDRHRPGRHSPPVRELGRRAAPPGRDPREPAIRHRVAVGDDPRPRGGPEPPYPTYGSKSFLRAPQTGQNQSSGMSSKGVPGGMPPSGSPSSGS
jgi:adenosylmethionine-8-amino-7-oxononanoate aminotransferase